MVSEVPPGVKPVMIFTDSKGAAACASARCDTPASRAEAAAD